MSSNIQNNGGAPRNQDLQNFRNGYGFGLGTTAAGVTVGAVIGVAKLGYTAYTAYSTAQAGAVLGAAVGGPAGAAVGGTTGAVVGVARGVFFA
jgi:hypothetical protein